ncbi:MULTISPECIES: ABC transporter substrate-binding protein [unclassified Mycoplasma]|uniref:ABC transporter substrate-binding protein n=1 Tax=unclassified Mycoplasma TaxID=2683645 RepID=UPI00211CEBB1|nr:MULTISPECIES: ABC transporter substrate-binding protein [unclassified Mycoplasma]UUM19614.1 ABC transporter substrate-binding protein [Mycoplasma sp. 1578d]UUM24584.1 ABC transporter substrate-binding protein [Mycoplasma sp. 3686d]
MKRKLKLKKAFLLSGTLLSGMLTATAISCSAIPNQESFKKDYDFGLATEPLNNLNYVRYSSVDRVLPSLVESFTKQGPTESLRSIISIPNFIFSRVDATAERTSDFNKLFKANKEELLKENGYGAVPGRYYNLVDLGVLGGLGKPSGNNVQRQSSIYAYSNPNNSTNYVAVTGLLNEGNNLWSNGDVITAQDMRDFLEYILDLNTGSQKLDRIIKLGIRGSEQFINAQKDYIAKFNKAYPNPWGRRKYVWDSELKQYIQYVPQPGDKEKNRYKDLDKVTDIYKDKEEAEVAEKYQGWQYLEKDPKTGEFLDKQEVDNIRKAALNFGFYTGQLFLDYGNEQVFNSLDLNPDFDPNKEVQDFKIRLTEDDETGHKIRLVKNQYVNPYQEFDFEKRLPKIGTLSSNEYAFTLIFDENKTAGLGYLFSQVFGSLYPINRKYVETEVGGIDKYGANVSKFLTSGPFKIASPDDIVLGPQGFIILTKNQDYFDASNTISNKIKIFFSTDRTTNSTFFEDGYISQTYIQAQRIVSYWSDPEYKKYLNKNQGFGTIAFGFNLDAETNANSYINDQDLRNYIYYSINRGDLLKTVNWDFSFPVNTWTAFGQYKLADGRSLEMFFDSQESKAKNDKEFPLQNYDFLVHLGKSYELEKTNRSDITYSPKTAEFYLERFKKKHPDLKSVTLRYLNNSSEEQRRAGNDLQERLRRNSNGFINIETKALPENTYASFIETGQYDIIYRNYDYIGGNTAQDYVSSFFKTDEIDSLSQKGIGLKYNPVGSWTYETYLSELLLQRILNNNLIENLEQEKVNQLKPLIDVALKVYNENKNIKDEIAKASSNSDIPARINKILDSFKQKALALVGNNLLYQSMFNNNYISKTMLEYIVVENPNIKASKLEKLFEAYFYYLIDTNSLDTVKGFKIDFKGKTKDKQVTLDSNSLPIDPKTGKTYNLSLSEKYALATFDTVQRLEGLIVPFTDFDERIEYFKKAINNLKNLTNQQKQEYNLLLADQTDVDQMKDIFIDALNTNKDEQTAIGLLFDYQLKELRHWSKFIELALVNVDQKDNKGQYTGTLESGLTYQGRINRFFSGNFTPFESEQGWNSNVETFRLIALLEKVVRDGAPVIPLMEVDTNWEITKIGGIQSLFTFSLQYAYDVTNPPRPGLPRKRDK